VGEPSIVYKFWVTPETAENITNFAALLLPLLGAQKPGVGGEAKEGKPAGKIYVGAVSIAGYKRLPFDFNITCSFAPPTSKSGTEPAASMPAPGIPLMPPGHVNVQYSEQIRPPDEKAPGQKFVGRKTFKKSPDGSNPPPAGLDVDPAGLLFGLPQSTGDSTFTVVITDSQGLSKLQQYEINIDADSQPSPLKVDSPTMHEGLVGTDYSEQIPIQGGLGRKTFNKVLGHEPPAPLDVEPAGILSGRPSTSGTNTFLVEIADANGLSIQVKYTITINSPGAPPAGAALEGGASKDNTSQDQKQNPKTSNDGQKSTTNANPGPVDCTSASTGSPCTVSHSFRSDDKEWWDVSMGVTVPGVLENKYSSSNPSAPPSTTRHTDVYGFFDLYPFAAWRAKDSPAPHVNIGLPVTGKPFYRPYFGVAENLTSWKNLEGRGFPIPLSVFFGFVDMRVQYPRANPAGSPSLILKSTRIWKPLFGVEIPVSALASAIKGGSSGGGKK
jgi:hypothetical protein